MNLETIPLSQLVPASCNVRKTGALAIDDLAASIAAHGLLQNLQVRPLTRSSGTPSGKYEVIAGGRRLAALKRLAKEKVVPKDYPVACNVLAAESGAEISLAENVIRQAMHPADQFEAFAALAEAGCGAEEIAARFGASVSHVRKMLRLAAVSPRLMAAYRDGNLTLEQLMAFTVTGDYAAQERVWENALACDPSDIRAALSEAWVEATGRLARFVGLDAYVAAGGAVVRDLFQESHEGYLSDRALLDRLAREKLDALVRAAEEEGWQWAEVIPDYHYPAAHGFTQLAPEKRPLPEAEAAEQEALADEYDALAAQDLEDEAVVLRLDAIERRLDELANLATFWPDAVKAVAGVAIHIRRDGTVAFERGLARGEDLPQAENDNDAPAPRQRPALSSGLVRDLTAHRTAALRAALAGQPEIALDSVIYTLALPVFYAHCRIASCLAIRAEHPLLGKDADGIEESPALQHLKAQHDAWVRRLPEADTFWSWLRAQPQADKLALLAFCAAQSVQAVRQRLDEQLCFLPTLAHADALHRATGLDMADWWQPTRARYLGRVSKPQVLEALIEAVSRECADAYRERKRDALIDIAERKLAGTGWLPALLRQPALPAIETAPGVADADPSLLQAA